MRVIFLESNIAAVASYCAGRIINYNERWRESIVKFGWRGYETGYQHFAGEHVSKIIALLG